jgi:hypothetical protein
MKKLPTDLEILNAIYEQYYETFAHYTDDNGSRRSKVQVPIDIHKIAADLKVDGDIIFGRLYYHLNKKYAYLKENGAKVSFFELMIDKDKHCINFPLMASVLADLRDKEQKHNISMGIAIGSIIISFFAIIISIFF